jgi:enediyne biosynthesis protein E3
MSLMLRLRSRMLAVPLRAASFSVLGFEPCDAEIRGRLERILETFLQGYNLALALADQQELAAALRGRFDDALVGFGFEGAGMAYALLDLLAPWRPHRLRAFVTGAGRDHDYISMVGAGFAIGRLPWGRQCWPAYARRLDPLVAWCLADGYGFYEGMRHPGRYLGGHAAAPAGLAAWARRLFDSGLGRSLWWSQGAEPHRIARAIGGFPAPRQPEMWCGVGIAAAYTGAASDEALATLRQLAGRHLPDLQSGVPFAARMRDKGGNPSQATDRACRLLLGSDTAAASQWLVDTLGRVADDESIERTVRLRDAYLLVRRRLLDDLRPSRATPGDPAPTQRAC